MYAKKSIYSSITSRTRARVFIAAYLSQVKEITKRIYSFIRFNDKGEFVDKSVKKDDIMFLFVRHVDSAFSGDVVQPAEIALVGVCRAVDPHYTM